MSRPVPQQELENFKKRKQYGAGHRRTPIGPRRVHKRNKSSISGISAIKFKSASVSFSRETKLKIKKKKEEEKTSWNFE